MLIVKKQERKIVKQQLKTIVCVILECVETGGHKEKKEGRL